MSNKSKDISNDEFLKKYQDSFGDTGQDFEDFKKDHIPDVGKKVGEGHKAWVNVETDLPKEKGKTCWSEHVLVYANGDYFVDVLFKGTKEFWLSHREDIT